MFSKPSVLPGGYPGGCGINLDFTYFQTVITVPANTQIQDFKISYDVADDGARVYLFNTKTGAAGSFNADNDLIGSSVGYKPIDLKSQIAEGENRIVIVQYDNCPVLNRMIGIHIKVGGKDITPPLPPVLPAKFKLHAYSINGKRVEKGTSYWMGIDPANSAKSVITQTGSGKLMEIEKVDLGNNIIALKVTNGAPNTYLVATSSKPNTVTRTTNLEVVTDPKTNKSCQFYVRPPQEAAAGSQKYVSFESVQYPNNFLRHQGFVLFATEAVPNVKADIVYRQDASWLFEKL